MDLFRGAKPVIGVLHVPALPGSPGHTLEWVKIRERVVRDARTLAEGGVDGLILENFGDTPFYPRRVPPHAVAFLTVLGREVKTRLGLPLGVNVLRNDALAAMAVAAAVDAEFIRVNVYTGARVTDQGVIEGEAHEVQRYRKLLGAGVRVWADVAVKHSAALGERALAEEVEDAVRRGRADAILVSGEATGKPTQVEDLREAKGAAGGTPVLAASGVSEENLETMLRCADGVIVGSAFETEGLAGNPVEAERVRRFMQKVRGIV